MMISISKICSSTDTVAEVIDYLVGRNAVSNCCSRVMRLKFFQYVMT